MQIIIKYKLIFNVIYSSNLYFIMFFHFWPIKSIYEMFIIDQICYLLTATTISFLLLLFRKKMNGSIPAFEKPHPRISVLDWTRNIQRLQNEARLRRFESYELRQRANQLRNETSVTTRWDTYTNNELMRDRYNALTNSLSSISVIGRIDGH